MNNEQSNLFSKIIAGVALLFAALAAWRFVEAFRIQNKINQAAMWTGGQVNARDIGAPSSIAQWGVPVALTLVAVVLVFFAIKRLRKI